MSCLDYANALLCDASDKLYQRLQKIQNSAARLITGTTNREHITPVLRSLHWLPVRFRVDYKLMVMVYQAIHRQAPEYIQELVTIHRPVRSLRSANELRLQVPRVNTVTYGQKSFKNVAAVKWNSLPAAVKESPSLACFKRTLKTHLFKSVYEL